MTCGSCPFTNKLCYCSMPPQVKCTITNEFRYYDDECNCVESMTGKKAELDFITKKLSEPGPLMAINYDGLNAPSVSFVNSLDETTVDNTSKVSENGIDSLIFDSEAWKWTAPVTYGITPCLVCGTGIEISSLYDNSPKICSDCKRTIRFIKEKFKVELESFEQGDLYMKCGDCNYGEVIVNQGPEHDGSIKCKLTGEEHINIFECNCDFTRTRRDKEAKLLKEKAAAIEALEALKNNITKPSVDVVYVIKILTDTTKEAGVKITEAIEYLEDFV